MDIRSQRKALGFEDAVVRFFRFLEADNGFYRTEQSELGVRFESETVFIDVFHGLKDYEVGICFGLLSEKRYFSFNLYVHRFFPERVAELAEEIAGTPDKVLQAVERLSALFKSVGQKIVEADAKTYEEMKSVKWWHFRPEVLRPKVPRGENSD